MASARQDLRQTGPLLVRPGERREPVQLAGEARLIAEAAAAAASCGVPVDVAVWVSAEVLAACPDPSADRCRDLTVQVRPVRRVETSDRLDGWKRQLRQGSGWAEDSLPVIWAPARLKLVEGSDLLGRAVAYAGCPTGLRAALDLECAAAAARMTVTDAVGISAPAGTGTAVRPSRPDR